MRTSRGLVVALWILTVGCGGSGGEEPDDDPTPDAGADAAPPYMPTQVPFTPEDVARYQFAYTAFTGDLSVRFANLDGEWSDVPVGGSATDLALSPDRMELAYASYDAGDADWSLHVLSFVTFETRKVVAHIDSTTRPRWTPDSVGLFYVSTASGTLDLLLERASGGDPPSTVVPGVGPFAIAAGASIADAVVYHAEGDRVLALHVVSGDSTEVVAAHSGTAIDKLRVSPDGATLAVAAGPEVSLVPTSGGPLAPLTTLSGRADYLAWRPDGSALAVVDFREHPLNGQHNLDGEVLIVDRAGATTHVDWTASGTGGGDPQWSPDGAKLLYVVFASLHGNPQQTGSFLHVYDVATATGRDLELEGAGFDETFPTWLRESNEQN
jgi:dipeptidyl aminopeptidase/acylaminoacyl peptidase